MPLTEARAQNALFSMWEKAHALLLPNFCIGEYEADFVVITKKHIMYEYEVKCSRPDMLMEIRAIVQGFSSDRANLVVNGINTPTDRGGRVPITKWYKHNRYGKIYSKIVTASSAGCAPNYYYLALKRGIYKESDFVNLPSYVGIVEIYPSCEDESQYWLCRDVRKAKRLHSDHVSDSWLFKCSWGVAIRYWRQRLTARI